MIIVISGPDGAGKSHVINGLRSRLTSAHHFHLFPRPHVIGSSAQIANLQVYGTVVSVIKLAYIIFKFYYFFILNVIFRRHQTFIFDRYADEVLVTPARFRVKLPDSIIRIAVRVIPSPDVRFLLRASVEDICRKGEITTEQAELFYQRYEDAFPHAIPIFNDFKSDNAIEKIYDSIPGQ